MQSIRFPSHAAGAGSAPEIVPSFLRTLLEGSAEQLRSGPVAQYEVDDLTRAALTALKESIDALSPEHIKALVNLLVIPSFYHHHHERPYLCSLVPGSGQSHPKSLREASPAWGARVRASTVLPRAPGAR